MPQSLTPLSSSSNGNGEAPAKSAMRAVSPPPSPSSAAARAARSSRSKRGGSSVARRRLRRVLDNTQKHYAPHICRFAPYRPPAAVMLDPFPSLRINGLCMAGLATLVTVHRSGVRLYRERHLPSAASPLSSSASVASLTALRSAPLPFTAVTNSSGAVGGGGGTASGVFEQLEARNDFQVRESYLCAAMQPVLMDKAVLLSKWSRYFCVASGNDRVVHSVAVMSSGAHFCLHHERHQTNKVVCMHCTQVATEPFHPAILKPAVVSVDEVGTAVLFDVEREMPAVLERAPLWFRQVNRANEEGATGEEVDREGMSHPRQPSLLEQQLSPEEEDHVVEAMEKVPVKERATYHFDHGVATRVTLVGPCLELCNHCHNAFMSLAPTRGYLLVSMYISSRARDVQCDDGGHNAAATPVSSSSCATASAELNVVLLRVLWGPRRAFVLEEVRLVREAAPTDVCEAGVATAARPYQVGLPITLLLARPALSLWQLHACTGARIDTRHLYALLDAKKSSSDRHGGSKSAAAPRSASEFIIHWVPLGRHRLTMQHDDRIGPQSWFCIAAVTDDDTVLLLGRAPQSCRTSPTQPQPPVQSPARPVAQAATSSAEKFTDANLEGWLDDLNPSPLPSPLAEKSRARKTTTTSTKAAAAASSDTPYTVLMQLYSPSGASAAAAAGASASASAPSVAAGVVSIMPDLHDNRLILFMADEEALVSVPLPFADRIATLTDSDPQQEGEGEEETSNTRGAAGVDLSGAAETIATNGYSQYLWGATSKAVTAASQGWSSSVQRWAPSSSSYFSFAGSGGGGSASPVREAESAPPAATSAPPPLATTPAAAAEPYHAFSIARPLMAAVFHFTGEDKEPPSTTAPAAVSSQRVAPPLPPALPAEATAQPPSSLLNHNQRQGSLDARSASEASTSAAATAVSAATSLAVPIRVAFGQREGSRSRAASSNSSRHSGHRRRLPHPHRAASTASLYQGGEEGEDAVINADGDDGAASTTRGGGGVGRRRHRRSGLPAVQEVRVGSPAAPATTEDTTAQTSYMEQQMALLTEEVKENGDGGVSSLQGDAGRRPALRTQEELQYVLRRLVDVDEPLERNMVLYSWKDGHNDLYIRLCVGQDALEQAQAVEDAAVAAAGNAGHISPRANRSASPHVTHVEPLRFVTHTSAEVVDGVHSVGFLEQYHAAATWRTSTASYGNCFNFSEYFSTLQVPQHVLDVQERDKCRLELEDLRLQQVRDMASVHPFAVMTVCQNEERVSADAEWRLHATFPYDDERDGRVVDLNRLNRNAGSQRGAAAGGPEWRWATAKEARIWAEEEEGEGGGGSSGRSQLLTRRVRSLVKEQKDWAVGPWEYAERWPPHTSTGAAATSAWCSAEAPAHRCRRRRLRRLRVNVDELRRQTELTASHVRELGALREELGL